MSAKTSRLQQYCRRVLEEGALDAKLAAPPSPLRAVVDEARHDAPLALDAPTRVDGIAFAPRSERLPKPSKLREPEARRACLARFAHHELMAVELFAWALLRWPELPGELRLEWLRVLQDEQRHCRLYLERLHAHGSQLGDHPQAAYFWRHVPEILSATSPPLAFLSGMGLTLEQANLDFTLTYAEAFRRAGDVESARVCERVHADEVRHVEIAARWLRKLGDPRTSETERYEATVPPPLGAARAKGRHFDRASRERAGLSETFIEHVRTARSPQEFRGTVRLQSRTPRAGGSDPPENASARESSRD